MKSSTYSSSNLSTPALIISPLGNIAGGWVRSDKDGDITFATPLKHVFQQNPVKNSFVLATVTANDQHHMLNINYKL